MRKKWGQEKRLVVGFFSLIVIIVFGFIIQVSVDKNYDNFIDRILKGELSSLSGGESCFDSDFGKIYDEFGNCEDLNSYDEDVCVSGGLKEWYCNAEEGSGDYGSNDYSEFCSYEIINCDSRMGEGYFCDAGRCTLPYNECRVMRNRNPNVTWTVWGSCNVSSTGFTCSSCEFGCNNITGLCIEPDLIVTREIINLGNDSFRVELTIDVNENSNITSFIITEDYPIGWQVVNVSHGGVWENSRRLNESIIEWIGNDDFSELLIEDTTIIYNIIKTNSNSDFSGSWMTVDNQGDIIGDENA